MHNDETSLNKPAAAASTRRLAPPRKARAYGEIGNTKLYDLINKGKIVAYKRGRQTLIDLDSIDAYHAALPRIQPKVAAQ